jgi:hypothetical protein
MPKDIFKPVRHNVYDEKNIPEKNCVPIYKRVDKGRTYFIKGFENMWQFCRVCNELKHQKDFTVHSELDKYARRKLRNICRDCDIGQTKLIRKLKHEQGEPPKDCQLCGEEKKLQLDHCHKTNEFRGWLCNDCNSGLGKLGDDVPSLERGIKYLKGELKENKNDKD